MQSVEVFSNWLIDILTNSIWGQLFWCILSAVIGVALSAFMSMLSSNKKHPSWYFNSTTILDTSLINLEKLKASFGGNDVKNLAVIDFLLRNTGKAAIRKEDIVEPLMITVPEEFAVYSACVIEESRDSIEARVSLSAINEVEIDLKYLDYGDYIRVQFISNCTQLSKYNFNGRVLECEKFINGTYDRKTVWAEWKSIKNLMLFTLACHFVYAEFNMVEAEFLPMIGNESVKSLVVPIFDNIVMFANIFYALGISLTACCFGYKKASDLRVKKCSFGEGLHNSDE